MFISTPIKVAGAAALGATAIGGGYHIYDFKNPTGKAWLNANNHTFSIPKFGEHEKISQGCSQNLFRPLTDQTISESEVYGCSVLKIEGWGGEEQFGKGFDKQAFYVKFSTEISFRKGNEGWSINIRVDNYSQPSVVFDYLLTEYEYSSSKWTPKKTTLYSIDFEQWKDEKELTSVDNTNKKIKVSKEYFEIHHGNYYASFTGLVTKYPKESDQGTNYTSDGLIRKSLFSYETAEVWFSEPTEETRWLFRYTDIGLKGPNFSPVFCKDLNNHSTCFKDSKKVFSTHNTSVPEASVSGKTPGTWEYEKARHSSKASEYKPETTLKPILQKVKDNKGRWVKIEDACNLGTRNPDDNRKKQIRMYCTNN